MMAKDLIIKHERLELKPYKDTVGKLTIGVGRNLDDMGISEDEAMYMFKNDIKRCKNELCKIFSNFNELPDNVKLVLTDMIFNLGKNRFLEFKKMIAAIKEGDFKRAAEEAKNSKWCGQVKSRCKDDCKLLTNF